MNKKSDKDGRGKMTKYSEKEIYEITSNDTVVEDVKVKQYGIVYKCYNENKLVKELEITEISEDKAFVEYITKMLNTYEASPNHFNDIVEDFLIAKYTTR